MVDQPAYLRNLKTYTRARYQNDDDVAASVADLSAESDRGAIMIAATQVEDMLEHRIVQLMPNALASEPLRKKVFEIDGPIASFSRKTLVAFAMGIIDERYKDLIELVREIRNACAHSRKPISMKTPELRAICEVLIADILADMTDRSDAAMRQAVIGKCSFISHYILTGEKHEGSAAMLAYYRAHGLDI
jgi:hypothetical protein